MNLMPARASLASGYLQWLWNKPLHLPVWLWSSPGWVSNKGTALCFFNTLHTPLAAFPRALHKGFVHGVKVPPCTRFSVPDQPGTHQGKLWCRGMERKELLGWAGASSARKSLHLAEWGLGDNTAHCLPKQCGISHPVLMGSVLILKVALGPGLERAPTNPPQASVIPLRKQLLPPIFPGA